MLMGRMQCSWVALIPPHAGTHHTDSVSTEITSIPRNVSAFRFSTTPHDGACAEAAGGLTRELSAARVPMALWVVLPALLSRVPHKSPPLVNTCFGGDLSCRLPSVNPYLHQGMPNLFGLRQPRLGRTL